MATAPYDPFGQGPVTLLPEEDDQQQPQQPAATQPTPPPAPEPEPEPLVGGPNDIANQDLEERVPSPVSRLVIKPEAISEKPPIGPYRAPDPFMSSPEERQRFDDFFRHPDPKEDEFQEHNIAAAKFYFGPKTKDNPKGEYGFPDADLTPNQKKRLMFLNDGYGVPITQEDGTVLQQGGRFARLDLYPSQQYREFTTPTTPRGGLAQAADVASDVLFAPTGDYGDLQSIDNGLKEVGLNQNARTFYLKMYATREFDLDTLKKSGSDMLSLVASMPAYAQDFVTFLHNDVAVPAFGALFGVDVTDYREKIAQRPQTIDYEIPDYVSRKAQEYDVLPAVLESMFYPRGGALRAGAIGIEELSMYGPLALGKVGVALKRAPLFDSYLKETYEVDNYIDAFKIMEERGESFTEVAQNFLDSQVDERMHQAFRESMDLVFGLRVMRPGTEERTALLRDSMEGVSSAISEVQKDLTTALRVAKNDETNPAVIRARKRLENLYKERDNLQAEVILPKYLSDAAREFKGTVTAVTGAGLVAQDFFGLDEQYQPLVEFSAVVTMALKPSVATTMREGTRNILRDITSVYTDFIAKGFSREEFLKARKKHKLSREARQALDEINKLPTELRNSFLVGIEEAGIMRRELIELSEKTGVDLDPDAFIENIAILSDIGSLVTLSRNIRDKISLDGFDKIQGELAHKEEILNAQTRLVSSMAEATKKLMDLRIAGDLDETSAVYQLGEMMQRYVTFTSEQLAKDREGLQLLIQNTPKQLTAVVMSGATSDKDSLPAITSVTGVFDISARAGHLGVSQRAIDGVDMDVTAEMQDAGRTMDQLQEDMDMLMDDLTRSLNPEDAASGSASSYYTMALAARKFQIRKQIDEGYANFDTQYPNARANVSSLWDVLLSDENIEELNGFAAEEILEGTLKFANKQLPKGMKKGFAAIFNDGAREGIERVIKSEEFGMGAADYDALVEALGVGKQNYIGQVVKFKKVMDDLSEENQAAREAMIAVFGDEDTARAFGDSIPILVSTADWRLVNKVLHKAAGKNEDKRTLYRSIIKKWEDAGRSRIARMNEDGTPMMVDGEPVYDDNPLAFRTGWFDAEEPSLMGDEIYTDFRNLQDTYRTEVAERIYYSKKVSKLDAILTRPRAESAAKSIEDAENLDEWNISDFRTDFGNTDFSPTQTLDELFGNILKMDVTPTQGRLLDEVEEPIAKTVGMYDPETKRFYIVVEDEMEPDSSVAKLGKNTQTIFTRWLQGKLASTKSGQKASRRGGRKDLTKPGAEFQFNREGFEAFANVQVYRRTADGKFEPAGQLVDREQAYAGNTISTLESTGEEYAEVFDNAYDVVENSWKARAASDLGEYEREVQAEINFVLDLKKAFNLGGESGVSDIDSAAEAVFTAVTRSNQIVTPGVDGINAPTISRIRELLRQQGVSANIPADQLDEFVDNTIRRMTVRHLYNSISSVTGTQVINVKGGGTVKVPSIGMDGRKLLNQIGLDNPDTAGRLKQLLGEKNYQSLVTIGRVLNRMQQERVAGVDGRLPSISLDSVLSRVYNIQRQVVSTQWVATELLIRASKQHGGKLFQAMLTDPDVAKEVLDIVETGKIPTMQREPNFVRMLSMEIVRQEAINDQAVSSVAEGLYTGITGVEVVEQPPIPAVRTPGTPFGTATGTLPDQEPSESREPTPPTLTPLQQQMRRLGRNPFN